MAPAAPPASKRKCRRLMRLAIIVVPPDRDGLTSAPRAPPGASELHDRDRARFVQAGVVLALALDGADFREDVGRPTGEGHAPDCLRGEIRLPPGLLLRALRPLRLRDLLLRGSLLHEVAPGSNLLVRRLG